MKNVIQLLAERLPDAAQAIARDLSETYQIKDFKLDVSSGDFTRYNLQCYDAVGGFKCSWGSELYPAIELLKKELTPRKEIARRKREQAEKLLQEAALASA